VDGVVRINDWVLAGVLRKVLVVLALVGLSALITYLLLPKVEYLPNGNRNLIICLVMPPPGYNVEQLGALGSQVEEELRPFWNVDPDSPEAAQLDYPAIGDFFYVARDRQVFLGLRAADPSRTAEILNLVRDKFQMPNAALEQKLKAANQPPFYKPMPGTLVVAFQSSLFSRGLQGGRTVDVEITGPDLRKLVALGGRIMGQVSGGADPSQAVVPNAQLRPVPSLDLSSPELHVIPKLVQAREMGVSTTDLGYTVDALNDGAYATDFYVGGDKIDLVILGAKEFADHTQDIEQLPVATPIGEVVPLRALAGVEFSSGPEQVNHRERLRAITIQVSPPDTISLEQTIADINTRIVEPIRASGELGVDYKITMSGTADKLNNTWLALRWNLVLALLITYLLMAALFESWTYPLVIIFSVPLGAVGGVIGLWLLNGYLMVQGKPPQSLDVLTMLGFVILIGTVVNNPILIVHQALNHMRDDGMDPRRSVLESVRTRIRPIFMTTITTVFGLLPLVLFPGAGSELYRGLGSVVLGGLLISTIFTLVLVPAMFSLMMDLLVLLRGVVGLEPVVTARQATAPQGGSAAERAVARRAALVADPFDEPTPTEMASAELASAEPVEAGVAHDGPKDDPENSDAADAHEERYVLEEETGDGNGRSRDVADDGNGASHDVESPSDPAHRRPR
jgi:HAE1 family hydrophobic/amphiphilic exporter-1